MKWIAIVGGWRKTDNKVEEDVRRISEEIISAGDGIISGGALGVDFIATNKALFMNGQLKIIIPSTLEIYYKDYFEKVKEGVVTKEQAEDLIRQLEEVKRRGFLIEGEDVVLDKEAYFRKIIEIIENADKLIAFHINNSEGTEYAINKAKEKGIPIQVFNYTIK